MSVANEKTPERDEVPDLPDELDGLPDTERRDGPSAIEEPEDPDAHGPLIQA